MTTEGRRRFITERPGIPPTQSPISHAVVVGNTCWISGQISVDDDGRYRAGTVREETERAFQLLLHVTHAAGFRREELAYVDVALQNLTDLSEVNQVFGELFEEGRRPARTVYEAASLPGGAKVKLQAVASR